MTTIDIRFNEAEHRRVIASLNQLIRDGEDLSPAMLEVSELLADIAAEAFDRETSPDGVPWKALQAATLRAKRRLGYSEKILLREGDLSGSILSDHDRTSAVAGTNLIYAATHQLGRTEAGIPARPFLGIGQGGAGEIVDIVARHLAEGWGVGVG
ncbi:MAG: phage virion morphogenesis protein [Holophagales bacterium]|nr:phage virion morphogenesis protein [Holophagales bacterium]MYC11180.1 phage virion morphogenesis protein [Holophagales bacterium]